MTRTPSKKHEINGPPPGDIGVYGGSSCILTRVDTNNVRENVFFATKNVIQIFFPQIFRVIRPQVQDELERTWTSRLACKKLSWISLDDPKMPDMRRNEKTILY